MLKQVHNWDGLYFTKKGSSYWLCRHSSSDDLVVDRSVIEDLSSVVTAVSTFFEACSATFLLDDR
ncbi:hypothetical protein WN55_07779 [Dufourea novaeangliae]|uniref:Uncharacterized protein n=1 Tax=Dufourea novaeangliae TaxID=178035 RepID=A0A154P4P5_DUFNO|nr:hypothetical protein WN55_07779 [Dufourea novaeangliae]